MTTQSPDELIAEILKCERSFAYFYFTYCRIKDDQQGEMLPERWPHAVQVADDWPRGESWIEGKARQNGLSWQIAGYDNWLLRFRRNALILSLSISEEFSIELLNKVKFIHAHLPPFLRLRPSKDNETQFGLLKTGSSMKALPSTKTAGRGEKATLVQTDEWAFHEYAGENFSAYRNAIADGGQHIAISTGNGPSGMFYKMFMDPAAPYRKRFTGWDARPDRDQEWYDREYAAFLAGGEKHSMLFKRENPGTVEEMFTAFFGLVYDDFSRAEHMRAASFTYEQATWRIAGVDPGQGDPTAVSIVGESAAGHAHLFDEFHQEGATSAGDIYAYLKVWNERAPLHAVVVDGAEGTLIASLNEWFLRDFGRAAVAVAANKERGIGISQVAGRLRLGNFTIAPTCRHTEREFQSYRFRERRSPGEADPYATSTPVDHHADHMDTMRYIVMFLSQYCSNTRRVVTPGPDYRDEDRDDRALVRPDATGAWRDPLARRLPATAGPTGVRPDLRQRSGPRYRMTGRR